MSILIKGAEMPTDCNRCPIDYHYRVCNGHKERCSIVEVPEPHGRLIDADFEEQHYTSMTTNPTPDVTTQDYLHSAYTVKAFQMAKTVIEAEGE